MIKIVRAFHGISDPDRPSSDLGNCSPNQGKNTKLAVESTSAESIKSITPKRRE